MSDSLDQLVRAAGEAANTGRWTEAEALWREVRKRDPGNLNAALSLGVHAMQRREFAAACALLDDARRAHPRDPFLLLTLSRARRENRDIAGEGEALDAALAIDAYFLPALLAKGARLERLGARSAAAAVYRNCIKIAPPEQQLPPALRPQLTHAREFFSAYARELGATLDDAMKASTAALPPDQAGRWREAASIMAGLTTPYRQEANQIYIPRLPAIPFYDRKLFPWAADLESRTAIIRDELIAALEKQRDQFAPYIALRPGQPVDQWAALNHSRRWSHFPLWRHGQPDEANLALCPETRKALEAVDMASMDGLCPNVMFSALAPHTEIPPHTGESNARLVAHLPLIVPEKCTYRVGFEHRTWTEGELLVFDDTIEHTARNDSDELRVILIFDIWNPLLSQQEREVVRAMAAAARSFAS